MHYIGLFPIMLLAAVAACLLFRDRLKLPEASANRWCLGFTGVVFCIYFLLGWWKYDTFQFGLWDFGIYDSFMHNMASGKGFMRDFRGGLYDHFSPIMLLLVPLYWISDTPVQLIWFQSVVMAAGIPVMYALAKKYLRSPELALVLAAMYALNPYYSRLVLYDFHSECIFPAMFMGGFLAWAYHKRKLAMALWMSCYFIKEDFAVPLAGLGLYFLAGRNTRKYGVVLLLWSILMTVFVLKVYFPLLSEKGYWHYGRYELWGGSAGETLRNVWYMIRKVFSLQSGTVFLTLLLPFALLPFFHWRMFVFILLPTLGIQLVSANGHQNLLVSHYSSALIGVVPIAALWGLLVLRKWAANHQWLTGRNVRITALFLLVIAGGYHITCCDLPLARYYGYIDRWESKYHLGILSLPLRPVYYQVMLEQDGRGVELREVFSLIPAGSHVVCQNELGNPLLRTHKISCMPGPADGADYFLFDKNLYSGADDSGMLNWRITRCMQEPAYALIYREKGILLFARKKDQKK